MERIVFVQRQECGEPYSGNGASAARGFEMLGYQVQFFDRPELDGLPLKKEQ